MSEQLQPVGALQAGVDGPAVLALLRRLPEVRSAGLTLSEDGGIQQIKLVCSGDREPRHLAREVASLLTVWFRLEVPVEAIEVVQLLEEEHSRLRFHAYQEEPLGPQLRTRVILLEQDAEVAGEAQGPLVGQARVELAARATADAINRYFENPHFCHIEWAQAQAAADCQVVTVVTSLHGRAYSGSSIVRGDRIGEAAARAVLNSLNRQIAWPRR
ncbi:MAG: hypothetical protein ACYC5Y_00565 [Symbiobacteriia bacterium]